MQIKITMRYHLTPIRMAISKHLWTINAGEGTEKRKPPCTVGGSVNWYATKGSSNVLFLAAAAKSLQLCLTLCDPIDGSPPGSSVPGILQAKTLEWVAISSSNVCMHAKSPQSCLTLWTAAHQAPLSPGFRILETTGVGWHFLLPNSNVVSLKKTKNRTTVWPTTNPTIGHIPWESHNWKRHMYPRVHWSTVYNSQDMETTWISIDRWMDKDDVIHIYKMEF